MTTDIAKEKLYMEWQSFLEDNIDYAGISEAYQMAIASFEAWQEVRQEIENLKHTNVIYEDNTYYVDLDKVLAIIKNHLQKLEDM